MKKFLILAVLALALIVTAVACTGGDEPADTTADTGATTDAGTEAGTEAEVAGTTADTNATEETGATVDTSATEETGATVDTSATQDTEAQTEAETQEPLPYLNATEAGQKGFSLDAFRANGQDVHASAGTTLAITLLNEANNTHTFTMEDKHNSVGVRGWVGYDNQEIAAFGYYIVADGDKVTADDFVFNAEPVAPAAAELGAIQELAGEYGMRYNFDADLSKTLPGTYKVGFIAKLVAPVATADEAAEGEDQEAVEEYVVAQILEVTIVIEGLKIDNSIKYHSAIDWINYKGPEAGTAAFQGRGGNTTKGVDVIDAVEEGIAIAEDYTITLGGWLGIDNGTNRFVFSIDGGVTWIDATGGKDGEPLPNHYSGLGLAGEATKNGMFKSDENPMTGIVADLSAYHGKTLTVTFAAVSEADQTKVVPFLTITNYTVPVNESAPKYYEDMKLDLAAVAEANPQLPKNPGSTWDVVEGMVGHPILVVGYGNVFSLGEIDLSKYSSVTIEYSWDGENDRPDGRTAEQCFTQCVTTPVIGLVAVNESFGYADQKNVNAFDNGVFTEMEHVAAGWTTARTATVDLSAVNMTIPVYFSAYNPWGTEVAILSITFNGAEIPAEA